MVETTRTSARPLARPSAKQTFASFSHPNYRLWFAGQASSLVGTWMQSTAQTFLIFQLTHSPAFLGYVAFASGAPIWLLMLIGGVVSDRVQRRNLLLITQTTMMILAFILAALTFGGWVQPWHILVLAFCLGTANAFDLPARQAMVVELVGHEDLSNAIALNSTMQNLATATGPAVAGITYALFGPGWCFAINGISFFAVLGALLLMRVAPQLPRAGSGTPLHELKEGLTYVLAEPITRVLLLMVIVVTIFGWSFNTLLPAWAVSIMGGDSMTQGFMQSARGIGSLMGALTIASLGHLNFKGKQVTVGTIVFPIFVLLFAAVRWLPLSLLVIVGTGWSVMLAVNTANILVQGRVPDALRGRVMSIYSLSAMGMIPIGGLLMGTVAQVAGEPITIAAGALVSLAFAVWLWLRVPQIRALE